MRRIGKVDRLMYSDEISVTRTIFINIVFIYDINYLKLNKTIANKFVEND